MFTGQAYEDFRNKDPDIVEEDPATESYSIVSDSDAIAGGADVAAGELATTAHAAESTDWRLSAISLTGRRRSHRLFRGVAERE